MPVYVLLDTNFLLIPSRFGIDIFKELERILKDPKPLVTTSVLDELKTLRRKASPSFEREIDFAFKLVKQCGIIKTTVAPSQTVDDLLIKVAKYKNAVVATTDSNLRKRLRLENITVIYLRQLSHLELEGHIP